jgi:hypothetical protein
MSNDDLSKILLFSSSISAILSTNQLESDYILDNMKKVVSIGSIDELFSDIPRS